MMFSVILSGAFLDCDAGFPIRCRFDGKLFNLRRLQANSKVQTDVLDKLFYVDDLTENAKTETNIQVCVDRKQRCKAYTLLNLAQPCYKISGLPKSFFYGELKEGKRFQDGQKKRYKDTLKASLKDFNIPTESLEEAAQD